MHQMQYIIKTISPVVLTSISGDTNMVSTLDYIPGSVIRGIFAQKYIEKNECKSEAHKDPNFYNIFLNSAVCFTNAYIAKCNEKCTIYYPTPLSIQSVKTDETKFFDLINRGESTEQTKSVGKYCKLNGSSIDLKSADKSISFHHARSDRIKGCSDDGTIYNYESLDAQQEFSGRIIGTKEYIEKLFSLFGNSTNINIGRSRSIQYGQAELKFISDKPEELIPEFNNFNPGRLNETFVLTLLSPMILYNEYGFQATSISDIKSYLAESLGILKDNIDIFETFKKNETIERFVSIWQLKKPSEEAIKAGSCFKITINGFNENLKNSLVELQKMGIGEHTNEGFGRFALNLQENKEYSKHQNKPQDDKNKEDTKPDGKVPEITRSVIKNIVIKSFLNNVENLALEDCRGFCGNKEKLPTNSLLGKLELILNDSNSSEDFIISINKLTDTTKKKLEICRNKHTDLISFIEKSEAKIDVMRDLNLQLKNCCELIDLKPESDKELKTKIHKYYWLTFLRCMRKEKKKGGA